MMMMMMIITGRAFAAEVSSHNEWDPLEEVIVGRIDNMAHAPMEQAVKCISDASDRAARAADRCHPMPASAAALEELQGFVDLLKGEGVVVRRPEECDYTQPVHTPTFSTPSALGAACPRDSLLVVGDTVIEAPMSWRCRHFETLAFKPLLTEWVFLAPSHGPPRWRHGRPGSPVILPAVSLPCRRHTGSHLLVCRRHDAFQILPPGRPLAGGAEARPVRRPVPR